MRKKVAEAAWVPPQMVMSCVAGAIQPVPKDTRSRRSSERKYRVLISQDEDGVFVAEVPSLPGCVTQGSTRDVALANVREAIEGYVERLADLGDPIPPPISEEIIEE